MDEGAFLTGSGSKIPMPKREPTVAVVKPIAPKLTKCVTTATNYVCETSEPSTSAASSSMPSVEPRRVMKVPATNLKQGTARSIPNINHASVVVSKRRSKTFFGGAMRRGLASKPVLGRTAASSVKRAAAPAPVEDTPAPKQAKALPRTGFPYKAKNWELKSRLTECEEWLTELRTKHNEMEMSYSTTLQESEEWHQTKEVMSTKITHLEETVQSLKAEKAATECKLREKSETYDKLREDSKHFLGKIETLEGTMNQKDQQVILLQTDCAKLREELLAKDSTISQLRFQADDLEFKTKRQKNQIDDLESVVERNRKEMNELQSKVRDRDDRIVELQEKLDKAERDNRYKTSNISDLEADLLNTKSRNTELQNRVTQLEADNASLTQSLKEARDEITHLKATQTALATDLDAMKTKMCESEKLRRYLHNLVQDLKGNIRVFCRVRPPIQSEKENSSMLCSLNFPDEGTLEISKAEPACLTNSNNAAARPKFTKHEFSFDRVFNPGCSQEDVFTELSQLVQSALDGYNVCVFAYGQTGSGKTYTMEGVTDTSRRGMIPRTVELIFSTVKELELIGWNYTVEVSFLEIYNEVIRDLLRNDKEGANLKIMQVDGKTNDAVIPGLTVTPVESYEDLDRLYLLAHQNRAVAFTSGNERSSRSHSVTKIKVTGLHKARGETCYGSLYLVDLAGSERLNEPMSDPRFREMKNINKSLSELGNVILGRLQKQEHITYRNSKLTHLLQPALGGSSKTLMLVNISPAENCLQETLCSLRFAEKVNKVKMTSSKKRVAYDAQNMSK